MRHFKQLDCLNDLTLECIGIHWISFPAFKNAISHSPMFKHFNSSKCHANLRSTETSETMNIKTSSGSKPAGSQCQAVAMPSNAKQCQTKLKTHRIDSIDSLQPVVTHCSSELLGAPRCSGLHYFQSRASRALLGSAIEDHSWCLGQFPHATLERMTCKKRAKHI